jgi:cyanophycinase-like exopeptidase
MHSMGTAILIAHGVPGDALHDRAFELAGTTREVAWIGAANGDQRGWYELVASILHQRYGADVRMARTVAGVGFDAGETRRIVDAANVIYVAGGDVTLLAERVRALGLDEQIRKRHEAGALVVGISAGAIGLTRYWVEFPEDNPDLEQPTRFACIGALDVAVDCHDEESDWDELRALLAAWAREEPQAVVEGYGIPLGGALEVRDAKVTHLGPPPKRLRLDRGRIVE